MTTLRFVPALCMTAAVAACTSKADVNGPGVTATADISGNWGGHSDGQSSFDSLTATVVQESNDSIAGGGVYWSSGSRRPVKVVGVRVKDSLYLSLPDSTGSPPNALQFLGTVTKDSFGDELFGSIGAAPVTSVSGVTFTLHRRP